MLESNYHRFETTYDDDDDLLPDDDDDDNTVEVGRVG